MLKIGHLPSLSVDVLNRNGHLNTFFYGEIKRGENKPPHKNTVYYAESISKTVTTTAILQLYEDNKLSLDEDINVYLPLQIRHPTYPEIPITIEIWLTHSSGLSNIQWRLFFYFSI